MLNQIIYESVRTMAYLSFNLLNSSLLINNEAIQSYVEYDIYLKLNMYFLKQTPKFKVISIYNYNNIYQNSKLKIFVTSYMIYFTASLIVTISEKTPYPFEIPPYRSLHIMSTCMYFSPITSRIVIVSSWLMAHRLSKLKQVKNNNE